MRGSVIRVLLIDDDAVDTELTRRALAQSVGPRYEVERAGSLAEAAKCLRDTRFDVALLDLGLPDVERENTVVRFRDTCSDELPIIVLTGLADDDCALEALDQGAQDYLAKDDVTPDLLSRSIRYALQRYQLLEQLTDTNDLLEQKNQRLAKLYDTAQQFVENVSHEFRTPLTVIREFTSIIRDGLDGPVTPKQVEHLEKVIRRTDDLALMVDDMLDTSKLEAGLLGVWRRPYAVADLIDTACSMVRGRAAAKQIDLSVEVPAGLPQVFCDEEKARRVIINLAVNAVKFTPEGGTVTVWAAAESGADEVTIGITDTGPGISAENLSAIFERFRQVEVSLHASTKGFGLGLNIAKELVALNLGQILVESTLGGGSTFSFTLPKHAPPTVFRKYLDRLGALGAVGSSGSLLQAVMDTQSCRSAVPAADEFLQRSVRANDLVVRASDDLWVIVAACPATETHHLVERLETEWASFVRNSPQMKLPSLRVTHQGTWTIPQRQTELMDVYAGLFPQSAAHPSGNRRVLVIDDDREVSQCLGVRLEAAGFDVFTAADGEAGMTAALEHKPDAVVLDVCMPKKDGLTLLREFRMHDLMKSTPVVMLSASVRDQHRAIDAGANYFIPKPYEAAQVLSALETSLGTSLQEEALT